MTRRPPASRRGSFALAALLCLSSAGLAAANPSAWAEERLREVVGRLEGVEVTKGQRWLSDDQVVFGAQVDGRSQSFELQIRLARARTPDQAVKIYEFLARTQQTAKPGKYIPIKTATQRGIRSRLPLKEGRYRYMALLVEEHHIVRVQLDATPGGGAASLLKTLAKAAIESVGVAALPSAEGNTKVNSRYHLWEVENRTGAGMTMTIQVSEKGKIKSLTWKIAKDATVTLRVPPGTNTVTAVSDKADVRAFMGIEVQRGGYKSSSYFYVETRGR